MTYSMKQKKIVLTGGAGLVGQNLLAKLFLIGFDDIVVIDKHLKNTSVLKKTFPKAKVEVADLSKKGTWEHHFVNAHSVVMLHAQIGGTNYEDFVRNNLTATRLILESVEKNNVQRVIHISSSVVNSTAVDFYTNTKKEQELMVANIEICSPVILRPTLMYGWFDRKHLGWLSRFMKRTPIFPIPGNGKFLRQPLYAGDFCDIIVKCIENKEITGVYNISGHEKIEYVEIIRELKRTVQASALICHIPFRLFYFLLWFWSLFDRTPPFTTQQLSALCADDEFEIIDWPVIFSVEYTPFQKGLRDTFSHPIYSKVKLDF
jgi:nucleoside-diphosphate-sugar epimerase